MKTGKYYEGFFNDFTYGMLHAGLIVAGGLLTAVVALSAAF